MKWATRQSSAVIMLNCIDLVSTLVWLHTGWATESNAIMASWFEAWPGLFTIVKFLLVNISCCFLVYTSKTRPLISNLALTGAVALYLWVAYIHLEFLMELAKFAQECKVLNF
jgi:hypothetical protein